MNLNMNDLNKAETAFGGGKFEHMPSGIYPVIIANCIDNQHPNNGKQARLEIELEINGGEYAGFFTEAYHKLNFWSLVLFENYGTPESLKYFKGFIKRLMDSNPQYHFSNNETKMIGCKFYASIQAVESKTKQGKRYWKYQVQNCYSEKEFRDQKDYNGNDLAVYADKELHESNANTDTNASTTDDFYDINDADVAF